MNVNVNQILLLKKKIEMAENADESMAALFNFSNVLGKNFSIECYDPKREQIFRSLSFFERCSYPIVELLSSSYNELYRSPTDCHCKFKKFFDLAANGHTTIINNQTSWKHIEISTKLDVPNLIQSWYLFFIPIYLKKYGDVILTVRSWKKPTFPPRPPSQKMETEDLIIQILIGLTANLSTAFLIEFVRWISRNSRTSIDIKEVR